MNAIVVYDSKFGNTKRIANAIGQALGNDLTTRVRSVDEQPSIDSALDVLIIGGPTQAHGMSQPMRAFLREIPPDALRGVAVATFDTRFRLPAFLTGSAAAGIARELQKRGAMAIRDPESFFVSRTEGHPLEEGEEERAGAWARELLGSLAHQV